MGKTTKTPERPADAVADASPPKVTIYTDGGCKPNPGAGGWAAILIDQATHRRRRIFGGNLDSTNNRMELTAVISALSSLKRPSIVTLYTDSEYVKHAFTNGWLESWQKRGWKTADKKPVKNQDLWERLLTLSQSHELHWRWVRGHATDELNNECDALATAAREKVVAGQLNEDEVHDVGPR